jgi:NitT/TauT family transport system permease protein
MYRSLRNILGVMVFLLIWEGVARSGWVPANYFPSLGTIAVSFTELVRTGNLVAAEGITLSRALLGLGIGLVLALGLALAGALWPEVGRALRPLSELMRNLPPAALVPLTIFFLGLGPLMTLFIVAFSAIWPVYLNAAAALSTTDPLLRHSARACGLKPLSILRQVRLPAALPDIFTGIRIAAGTALLATVATEILAGQDGIGWLLADSAFTLHIPETFACLFVAGLNGILLTVLLELVRRPLLSWHDGMVRARA